MYGYLVTRKPIFRLVGICVFFAGLVGAGYLSATVSPTLMLLATAALLTIGLILRDPFSGLLVVLILEALRTLEIPFLVGSWFSAPKIVALFTFLLFLLYITVRRFEWRMRRSPLSLPLLIFIIVGAISSLRGQTFDIWHASSFISLYGFYFLTVQLVTDKPRLQRAIDVWVLMTVIILIDQIIVSGWKPRELLQLGAYERFGRDFGNPNGLALWLVLTFGPVLVRFIDGKTIIERFYYFCLSLSIPFFVILTGSRGGLLAVAIVFIHTLILASAHRNRSLPMVKVDLQFRDYSFSPYASRVTILVIVIAIIVIALLPSITSRWERLENGAIASRQSDLAVSWRLFQRSPIWGVGTSAYGFAVDALAIQDYRINAPRAAHNLYFAVLAQMGIIGFSTLAGIILIATNMIRHFQSVGTSNQLRAFHGLSASLSGFIVFSLTHSSLYYNLLWFTIALFCSAYSLEKQDVYAGLQANGEIV